MSVSQHAPARLAGTKQLLARRLNLASGLNIVRRIAAWLDLVPLLAVAALLGWMAVHAAPATAQTPEQVIATTRAVGGNYAPCLLQIEARETGGTYSATVVNSSSGAYGPLQYLQTGGVWQATPLGQAGLPVTVATVAEQVAMAAWALASGYGSAWAPEPAGCGGT